MQVAQRNLEIAYFNTGYYDTTNPELKERCARVRRIATRAGSSAARSRCSASRRRRPPSSARCCSTHPATSARCCSSRWPRSTNGDIEQRAGMPRARARARSARARSLHFTLGEVLYHRGLNEEALRRARARDRAQSRESRRALLMGFVLGDIGRHEEARAVTRARDQAEPVAVARAREPRDRSQRQSRAATSSHARRSEVRAARR